MQSFNEREQARRRYYRIRNWAVIATVWAVTMTLTLGLLIVTGGGR